MQGTNEDRKGEWFAYPGKRCHSVCPLSSCLLVIQSMASLTYQEKEETLSCSVPVCPRPFCLFKQIFCSRGDRLAFPLVPQSSNHFLFYINGILTYALCVCLHCGTDFFFLLIQVIKLCKESAGLLLSYGCFWHSEIIRGSQQLVTLCWRKCSLTYVWTFSTVFYRGLRLYILSSTRRSLLSQCAFGIIRSTGVIQIFACFLRSLSVKLTKKICLISQMRDEHGRQQESHCKIYKTQYILNGLVMLVSNNILTIKSKWRRPSN